MPNCFQLMRKGTTEPVAFQIIDAEICHHFGVDVHPKYWHNGWYDYIGFSLALGKSFDDIIVACEKIAVEPQGGAEHWDYWNHMADIARWLKEHFTADAWAEIGRR